MVEIRIRVATSADVPAMAACRRTDAEAGPTDPRMTAYFDGHHHPQQALLPRVGYVALAGETIIGYIAAIGRRATGAKERCSTCSSLPNIAAVGLRRGYCASWPDGSHCSLKILLDALSRYDSSAVL